MTNPKEEAGGQRLQKLLAGAALGSRRTIEQWIRAGRVTVRGAVAQLGDRASPGDVICVDGKVIALLAEAAAQQQLLIYHKPLGEVTTRSDPQNRPTVFEVLPPPPSGRWINVGRLDVNTSGLLLFTTDGELAHRLMHPSGEIEREYLLQLWDEPPNGALDQLRCGVQLEDGLAKFERLERERGADGATLFRAVLREGRNREVRRMWQAVGCEVARLQRTRYGNIRLPEDLRRGGWRLASPAQLAAMQRLLESKPGAAQNAGQFGKRD